MRKKIRENIINIINTMMEAHNHVMVLLQDGCVEEAIDILAQCQECAVHIGKTVEKNKRFNINAVQELEIYCEQLYELSTMENYREWKKFKKTLDKSLHKVKHEINIKPTYDKLKIVFMPYKASMWDCMESVWEAANADEGCETFVVPIPYYEKNMEGVIVKECYEANFFPDYVPIISYKQFSVEVEQPDVIYIHNPYDAANYVTSVYPEYYSSKLCSYTDQLIYLPYFLCGEGEMPETHQNLPAYKYIDKIIVQDEVKAKSLLEYIPEDKIIVIGSPKVDQLLKLARKKEEIIENRIPLDWGKKIKGKKVILFNTSISGILSNSKFAINKIRYVLRQFEKRTDVVLLWRPHPLIEATLNAMRPQLYKEYMEIKEKYISEDRGILDETENPALTALIADAYLGENSSSLVNYFGVLGKPVLYINWRNTFDENKERTYIFPMSFFIERSSLLFVPLNKGMMQNLYRFDLASGALNKEKDFPGISDNIWGGYLSIKKMQNKFILIPYNAKDIYIYDIDRGQGIKLVLSESHDITGLFSGSIEYNEKLFLIPESYPAIVCIDILKLEIIEFKECISTFRLGKKNELIFSLAYLKIENILYLASGNLSRILIFNMDNGTYEIKKIGNCSYGYGHMIFDGEYFWLSAFRKNFIVKWNIDTGEIKEYKYPIEKEYLDDNIWSLLIDKKDEIIICNGFSYSIIFVDKRSGKCRQDKMLKSILKRINSESNKSKKGFRSVTHLDEETVLLVEWGKCNVHKWNIYTNQWESYPFRISTKELIKIERRQIEKYWISKSTPYNLSETSISISQYLDYIAAGNVDIFKNVYECYKGEINDESIGDRIHKYVRKEAYE